MRPLLCHLSYAAVSEREQKRYRLGESESSAPGHIQRPLGLTHASGERREERLAHVRDLREQRGEVLAADHEESESRLRHHSRRSGLPVEQAHLAEEVPGTEP